MIIKPGWLIALAMMWVGIQLIITFGNGIQGQAVAISLNNQPGGYNSHQKSTLDNSPVMDILNTFGTVNLSNPIAAITSIVSTDWGGLLGDLWQMLTFQSNWLPGAWQIVATFVGCIYAGVWLSLLLIFVTKGL